MHLWNDPMLLPVILLQNYSQRMSIRSMILQEELVTLEKKLGVTHGSGATPSMKVEDWPKEVDVKKSTRELHSTMTQIIFLSGICAWASQYGTFILGLEKEIYSDGSLKLARTRSTDLHEDTLHVISFLAGLHLRFNSLKERGQTQINVVGTYHSTNLQARHFELTFM
jgi:hypothetical protein